MTGGLDCSAASGVSCGCDEEETNFGAQLPAFAVIASPYCVQPAAAIPLHSANRKPISPWRAHLPIAPRPPRTSVLSTAARNVASTDGADAPAEGSPFAALCGADGRTSGAGLADVLLARAARTTSGSIAKASCGSA